MVFSMSDPARWAICLVGVGALASPLHSLFSGTDQYDLDSLNSEIRLDREYFLDLRAYRPFWQPEPAAPLPAAFVRASEGSLNTDQLFIQREAGFRAFLSTGTFLGYQLRQRDDLEETFMTQYFEAEARLGRSVTFRLTGQPTAKKQDSDIGFGIGVGHGGAWGALEQTLVDFNFNGKNQDNERDRRKLFNTVARGGWAGGPHALEFRWEWESPVEREQPDKNQVFYHRAQRGAVLWRTGAWAGDVTMEFHRRALEDLAGFLRQSFRKDAVRGGMAWSRSFFQLGLEAQRRRARFESDSSSEAFERDFWEILPYGEVRWRITDRWSVPAGLYGTWTWEDRREGTAPSKNLSYGEAKLALPLRVDFNAQSSLVLMTTWDINPPSLSSVFDGGNAMFRAQWP